MCTCVWFLISYYEKKKVKVKVRIPRVLTSHEELGLNYKCGDKARWCDSREPRVVSWVDWREVLSLLHLGFPCPTQSVSPSSSLWEQSPL